MENSTDKVKKVLTDLVKECKREIISINNSDHLEIPGTFTLGYLKKSMVLKVTLKEARLGIERLNKGKTASNLADYYCKALLRELNKKESGDAKRFALDCRVTAMRTLFENTSEWLSPSVQDALEALGLRWII